MLKKPKKTKSSYTKIKRLRTKADKLWGLVIYKKWGNVCELCGRSSSAPHHFIPKGNCSALRYDVNNGVPLCYHHHHKLHYTGDPRITTGIIEIRGKEWYDSLLEDSKKEVKSNTIGYYQSQIDRLKLFITISPKAH